MVDFLIFYVEKGTSLKHISMRPEQQPNSMFWNMIFDESDNCYGFFNTGGHQAVSAAIKV